MYKDVKKFCSSYICKEALHFINLSLIKENT